MSWSSTTAAGTPPPTQARARGLRRRVRARGARPRPEPRRGRGHRHRVRARRWSWAPTWWRSWPATGRWIRPTCRALLEPVVDGRADYAKGNRLAWPGGWRQMPPVRLAGSAGAVLADAAWRRGTGRSSIRSAGTRLSRAPRCWPSGPGRMYPRYGYPNDLLARLAAVGARVVDVPVRPVYGAAWRSGLRPSRVVVPLGRHPGRARSRNDWSARAGPRHHREQPLRIGLLTTSFPRHAGDYAGSFVGDRVAQLARRRAPRRRAGRRRRPAATPAVPGLTVTRLSAGAGLFYGAGAPETLERGGGAWLAAARSSRRWPAAARARAAAWDVVESHWLVPCALAASTAAPDQAAARLGSLGRRGAAGTAAARVARWRGGWRGTGPTCGSSAPSLRARFCRLAGRRGRHGRAAAGPGRRLFAPRSRPDAALRAPARPVAADGAGGRAAGSDQGARAPAARRGPGRGRRDDAAEVVILGDGPERDRLAALAERSGVPLRLPGFVPRAEVADVDARRRSVRASVRPAGQRPDRGGADRRCARRQPSGSLSRSTSRPGRDPRAGHRARSCRVAPRPA